MKFQISLVFLFFMFIQCTLETASENDTPTIKASKKVVESVPQITPTEFERKEIEARLAQKLKNKEPFIAHVLVPLCDNEYQGIVPVSENLGNGQNLRSNLYWGALYGLKTHFKKLTDWSLVLSEKDLNEQVLERVVFEKSYPNGAKVILVIDAYRGDKMKACLSDFLNALAGNKKEGLTKENAKIGIYGNADLIGFNGHNGLMDVEMPIIPNIDERAKDAVVIGCVSYDYFKEYLMAGKGFPLLTTTNLMAPEAYVLAGTLDAWAIMKPKNEVREAAASTYHQYQKCGMRGARNLFKSGW